jgi:methylmalonyl-CoA/ethylmalonyl-CoA epimerase
MNPKSSATDTHPVHLDTIAQIAITVRDLARSKDFYQNTLGMKFLFDAGTMAFFQCGTIRLMIGTSDQPTAAGTILYFKVQDIHQTHAALQAQGVTFSHQPHLVAKMPTHDLWMAFLKDPDGNTLALMSELPPAP